MRILLARVFVISALLLNAPRAFAHSMYQSSVMLDFRGSIVEVELQLPTSRLVDAFGQPVGVILLPAQQQALGDYILSRIHATTADNRPFENRLISAPHYVTVDGATYIGATVELTPPPNATAQDFVFTDDVILDTLPSNVALVSIRSDWRTSTFANDPEFLGVLQSNDKSIKVDRFEGGWWKGFGSIFHLGVRHIAEGTDHLLFLLALLLPAPLLAVAGRWTGPSTVHHGLVRVLKIVTAFTLGHSLTLALAAFGLIRVPSRPIEVLIAISILVSAVHAIRPLFPGREGYIAAGFGLVHGLAFASTLAELGLTNWERVASILSFNLGIETMQLVVVAALLPSFMILSRTPVYPYFRIAGGAFAGLAAVSWIVQRTFETSNPVDVWISALSVHGVAIASTLFVLSVLTALTTFRASYNDASFHTWT